MSKISVALVSMPWAPLTEPSLGLSVLKADLTKRSIDSQVLHFSLDFRRFVTKELYGLLSSLWAVNDFLFSGNLDPGPLGDEQLSALRHAIRRDLTAWGRGWSVDRAVELVLRVREDVVPSFLEYCDRSIEMLNPDVVGFTCMFDQVFSSLALAKKIKDRAPSTKTIFGGYALEGPLTPALMRSFPFIDAILLGEGEERLAQFVDAVASGAGLEGIAGLHWRDVSNLAVHNDVPVKQIRLDVSPDPDFSDFFRSLASLRSVAPDIPSASILPLETSRGCWWGQRSHCIFCGIDEESLKYRAKTPSSVVASLRSLRARYSVDTFRFSDYIFPLNFYGSFLEDISTEDYSLHAEMKSNLDFDKLKRMRRAGFKSVQIGLESFSTPVLKLMKKGVSGLRNIETLRDARNVGIGIVYNLIYGFPGDQIEWYRDMSRLLPSLYHLDPPNAVAKVAVTRFAPLHVSWAEYGGEGAPIHEKSYDTILSDRRRTELGFSMDDYSYYFERYFSHPKELNNIFSVIYNQCQRWKALKSQREVRLHVWGEHDRLEVFDSRLSEVPVRYELRGDVAQLYSLLMQKRSTIEQLAGQAQIGEAVVSDHLRQLVGRGLVLVEGAQILALATSDRKGVTPAQAASASLEERNGELVDPV